MKTLLIACGLPGSGKSTCLERRRLRYQVEGISSIILSRDRWRDSMREVMLAHSYFPFTPDIERGLWHQYLYNAAVQYEHHDCIMIDSTNLTMEKWEEYTNIFKDREPRIILCDRPFCQCVALRPNIPHKTMESMYSQYQFIHNYLHNNKDIAHTIEYLDKNVEVSE